MLSGCSGPDGCVVLCCAGSSPHAWEDVGYSKWYIPTERRCRSCGAYSHMLWEDYCGIDQEPIWRDGPHPKC